MRWEDDSCLFGGLGTNNHAQISLRLRRIGSRSVARNLHVLVLHGFGCWVLFELAVSCGLAVADYVMSLLLILYNFCLHVPVA